IVLIIGVLFICKEISYPDSKNLNQKNK
ncbi:multidrug resistance protein SepA, partial [Staphylococcus saprophyticus]